MSMIKRWLRSTFLLLFLTSSSICHGQNNESWLKTSDESLRSKWASVDAKTRTKVGAYLLMKLGLSSTGTVELIAVYKMPHDGKLGLKDDRVVHFIQKDLFGSRLFWSCLVNTDQGIIQVLYHTSDYVPTRKTNSLDDVAQIVARAAATELRSSKAKLVPRVVRDKDGHVTRLVLTDMKLSAEDVAELGSLEHLRSLVLLRTDFTDVDLAALVGCRHLEHLNLTSTEVTNAAIDRILKLTSLKTVCLGNVKITPDAMQELKDQNRKRTPDTRLRWGYSQRKQ